MGVGGAGGGGEGAQISVFICLFMPNRLQSN